MTTQAAVSAHVSKGFVHVAANLGAACQQYRPSGTGNPLATQFGTVMVAIDTTAALTFKSPRQRAKPESWYAACDLTLIRAGDYLVTPTSDTYFVGAVDAFAPARLINCNAVVSIWRPGAMTPGPGFYGGDVATAGENLLATTWPCAMVQGTKGERGEVGLPGDTRLPWFSVLLPTIPGVQLRHGDVLVDTQVIPARYTVSSIELTPLGWRLSAALATP
jgi:hypothetical protein